MEISELIASAAVLISFVALVIAGRSYVQTKRTADANGAMAEANRSMAETNRDLLAAADEANWIAREANEVVRQAHASQEARDRASRSADLVLRSELPITSSRQLRQISVVLFNRGPVPAHNVEVELRVADGRPAYPAGLSTHIMPSKKGSFAFTIDKELFSDGAGGRVVDFVVTYEDLTGHHEKVFRAQMWGQWETDWSFKFLDIGLDGKRIPFPDAPGLAPGVALYGE